MLRYFCLSSVLLIALATTPASVASSVSAAQRDVEAGPPEDMIDFLGRRRECFDLAPEPGEVLPPPPPGSWQEWLRCDTLPAEELALRRRYGSDTRVIGFLDQAPSDFQLREITAHLYHGPPAARVQHSEQRGLDANGRIPWRMVLDLQAAEGRATAVTVSWQNRPSRTIYLDNQMFPWLDLTSASVALGERPHESVRIELRYGPARDWCGDVDPDDRSRVSLNFMSGGVEVSRQDRTNCNSDYQELKTSDFAAPPPAPRH